MAWHEENSGNKTHAVKTTSKANGLGIYDMSGNVWEWCHDWYGGISASTDPLGASSGSYRLYRGGSWNFDASYCSVADRFYSSGPNFRNFDLGFRVVRTAN